MAAPDWPPELKEKLLVLWVHEENGRVISVSEIARRLGISKNAVAGRALRIGLKRKAPAPVPVQNDIPNAKGPGAQMGRGAPERLGAIEYQPVRTAPATICQWPIGDPRAKDFCYCEARSVPGKSYCHAHVLEALLRFAKKPEYAE